MSHRSLLASAWLGVIGTFGVAGADTPAADPAVQGVRLLAAARQAYSSLRSYADTVTVITEDGAKGAPLIVERHRIRTYYRAPREFFFQFDEDQKAGAERFVIWCDGGDFKSWWSTTRVQDVYADGRGAYAFALGSQPTRGTSLFLAPLLFPQAEMKGPLVTLEDARLVGIEMLGSRRAHRIEAEARSTYATGNGMQERHTTVWLDAETSLVLKVIQETPTGSSGYAVSRITLVFEPVLTPITDNARFRFTVPSS